VTTARQQFETWPVDRSGYAVLEAGEVVEQVGDGGVFELASIAKLFAALTAMIAIEEGSLDLDRAAGPDGSTVRHLLAHASGLDFESDRVVAPVGERRVYSNTGMERYAEHLADRTGMSYADYLRIGVLEPLDLSDTTLYGSIAQDMRSSVRDVSRVAAEFMRPTLVSAETLHMARSPVFPELSGVLPGIGLFDPNPFGLAIEVKATRDRTGPVRSPRRRHSGTSAGRAPSCGSTR
jgi:CubicO group peptidase (beta-lactamase class C family)